MESLRLVSSYSKPSRLPCSGGNHWSDNSKVGQAHCSIGAGEVSRFREWNILSKSSATRFWQPYVKNDIWRITDRSKNHQEDSARFLVHAVAGQPFESEPGAYSAKSPFKSVQDALSAFYRFTRPHTIIGTTLSIISVSLLPVQKRSDLSLFFFSRVLEAVIPSLLMNVYIVGLNQITDIEIDKVNKPYLPLASGEYSVGTGVLIVASFALMSFWLSWVIGSRPLFWALFVSFFLGTAYSVDLPLLRWKRFAVVAAFCIVAVRALVVQLAFYLHMQVHVFKRPVAFSRPLIFATAFIGFFSTVIALFKDIPDIEGDQIFGIHSFSVHLGQEKVFWICITLLEVAYAVAIFVGAGSPYSWSKYITIVGHAILAAMLWNRAESVDLTSKASITACYMYIWKLFYAEYFLIPLVK